MVQTKLLSFASQLLIVAFLLIGSNGIAQIGIHLQIEVINSTDIVKFYVGDKINYRVADYPDTWRRQRITDILVEDNVIVFEDDFIHIDDFVGIRVVDGGAVAVGSALFTFGASWNIFGIIASLTSDFEYRGRDVAIGFGSLATGWLINKLFKYDNYNLKKGARLRIIDARLFIEE